MTDFIRKCGSGGLCARSCGRQDNKLNTYDWLADIPENSELCDMVEVQFKNTRKGYYKNSNNLKLEKGDIVAVEASPGHDIGTVTLTGRLVPLQMKKANLKPDVEIKRIYRKAKPVDMEKYQEAKAKEHATMIRSRQIAANLNLDMKIGDVEYQGDGNKAIFYYIADERVDFRQLIKVLAEAFRVRIEMKQIGARQEAGRIGGIGPCGRELCCATWMTSFVSVSTNAARIQDISLNPQKLAGQCAKLKCCLNYEVDAYVECQKRLPSREIALETKDGTFYYFKSDILKGLITYSSDKNFAANIVTITGRRAFEVINMNRKGIKPDNLMEEEKGNDIKRPIDLLEQESLTRFDRSKNSNKKKKKKGGENKTSASQQQDANGNNSGNPRNNEERNGKNRPNNGGNQNGGNTSGGNNEGNRNGNGGNQNGNGNGNNRKKNGNGKHNKTQRPESSQQAADKRPQGDKRPQQQAQQGTNNKPAQPNVNGGKPQGNQQDATQRPKGFIKRENANNESDKKE